MTKLKLKQNILKISTMNAQDLEQFAQQVSLSNMNKTAQTYLFRAIELRHVEVLTPFTADDSMAVSSNLKEVS